MEKEIESLTQLDKQDHFEKWLFFDPIIKGKSKRLMFLKYGPNDYILMFDDMRQTKRFFYKTFKKAFEKTMELML